MKQKLSALLALTLTAASMTLLPANAADALLHSGFESGADGWTARGSAIVSQSAANASSGSGCLAVSGRTESWNGAGISLDSIVTPGETYSFSAMFTQSASPMAVHFKLSLEYSTGSGENGMGFPGMGGGQKTYDCIAEADGASGMWTKLSNAAYTIPADANHLILYVETEEGSTDDFLVDEVMILPEGSTAPTDNPPALTGLLKGDVNSDHTVNKSDVQTLIEYVMGDPVDIQPSMSDLDNNQVIDTRDLVLLKRMLLNPTHGGGDVTQPVNTTQPVVTQSEPVQQTTPPVSGSHMNGKEYMAKVAATMTQNVPGNVKQGDQGKTEHFTYMSKKAGHNKGANVWLPPGYSADKKYNVMYMNHGVMGNEDSMLTGFSVREMASNLITSGEAEPFIIIFPQMYTDPASEQPGFGFNMDVMDHYDDFVFDLTDSLMPYVEEHWSVMTGRDHTAVAGFSMGGRESLYLGLMHPELFGYVCASSPAPGIVPASDNFIPNHLGSYNLARTARLKPADLTFSSDDLPYLLMIAGGTNDSVVGTFPKEYHQIFDQNGVPNIWTEVPGGGHDGGVGTPLFYNFFKNVFKA